jgi:hypothetical protein
MSEILEQIKIGTRQHEVVKYLDTQTFSGKVVAEYRAWMDVLVLSCKTELALGRSVGEVGHSIRLHTIEQGVNYLKVLKGWAHLKRQLMTGLHLIKPPHKKFTNIA